jgi:curved DNA-binding protein
MPRDYYEVLGVPRDADEDRLKKAFRSLARKHHPDVSKDEGAEARFKEVNEAYSVLSDPEKRRKYDQFGHGAFRAGRDGGVVDIGWEELMQMFGGAFGAGGAPRGGGGSPLGGGFGFDLGGGGGFGDLFGGGGRRRPPALDLEAELVIDVETAVMGDNRRIQLPAQAGGGSVEVKVPAGVTDGQKMRLTGKGRSGAGGKKGSLILVLRIGEHRVYRREGPDLEVDLPLAASEAAGGANVRVPTPDGWANLKVPPGVRAGQRLRFKGKGLPSGEGKRRGNLYFRVEIVMPGDLSDEQLDALREMERGFEPRAGAWSSIPES